MCNVLDGTADKKDSFLVEYVNNFHFLRLLHKRHRLASFVNGVFHAPFQHVGYADLKCFRHALIRLSQRFPIAKLGNQLIRSNPIGEINVDAKNSAMNVLILLSVFRRGSARPPMERMVCA